MDGVLARVDLESTIAQLHLALDALITGDPDYLSDEQSVSLMREFERPGGGWKALIRRC